MIHYKDIKFIVENYFEPKMRYGLEYRNQNDLINLISRMSLSTFNDIYIIMPYLSYFNITKKDIAEIFKDDKYNYIGIINYIFDEFTESVSVFKDIDKIFDKYYDGYFNNEYYIKQMNKDINNCIKAYEDENNVSLKEELIYHLYTRIQIECSDSLYIKGEVDVDENDPIESGLTIGSYSLGNLLLNFCLNLPITDIKYEKKYISECVRYVLGGFNLKIPKTLLKIYSCDKECLLYECQENNLKALMGDTKLNAEYYGYSEFSIEGFYINDFKIGNHDLFNILKSYKGKYVHLIFEFGK